MHGPHKSARATGALGAFAVAFVLATACHAGVTLTLAPGISNPAPAAFAANKQIALADTVQLVSAASFSSTLTAVNNAQGFTPAHNWIYSTSPTDLPAGLSNPVPLVSPAGLDSVYNLTSYNLSLGSIGSLFGETIRFSLLNAPADPVVNDPSATITRHWIQVVNTRSQVNGYGFALPGLGGFWQLDNGQLSWSSPSTGPFYDSNAAAGAYSTPYDFFDFPKYYQGVGNYLHFTVFPAWEVDTGGKSYQILGDTGLTWGFSVIALPEPSGVLWLGLAGCLMVRSPRRRSR